MKYFHRLILIILVGQMLSTPVFAYPGQGWVESIFSKKETAKAVNIKQNNNQNNEVNTKIGDTNIGATTVSGSSLNSSFTAPDVISIKNFSELISSNSETSKAALQQSGKNFQEIITLFKQNQIEQAKQNQEWRETLKALTKDSTGFQVQNSGSPPIPFDVLLRNSQTTPAVYKQEESQHQLLIQTLQAINTTLNTNNNMPFPSSGGTNLTSNAITQAAHGFAIGDAVYLNGAVWTLANSGASASSFTVGIISSVPSVNTFTITYDGLLGGLAGLTPGGIYYVTSTGTTGNTLSLTVPTTGTLRPLLIASTATTGYVQNYTVSALGAEYGENNSITNGQVFTTAFTDVGGSTFILPSAGVWNVEYIMFGGGDNNLNQMGFALFDTSNVQVVNSASAVTSVTTASTPGSVATNTVRITTTGSATYKLRGGTSSGTFTIRNNSALTNGGGNSKIIFTKVSGFLPFSGTSVDYVSVLRTTSQAIATNQDVIFDQNSGGSVPYNSTTGVFTLSANKTYNLTGAVTLDSAGGSAELDPQWYNQTTGAFFGPSALMLSSSISANANGGGVVVATITPTVTTSVSLRSNFSANSPVLRANQTFATIQQLGSSVVTTSNLAEYGSVTASAQSLTNTGAFADFNTPWVFTLPSAGVWYVSYAFNPIIPTTATAFNTIQIVDTLTSLVVAGSSVTLMNPSGGATMQGTGSIGMYISTGGANSYKFQYRANVGGGTISNNDSSPQAANSRVTFTKVASFLPFSGTTVDYISSRLTANTTLASNATIPFTTVNGNIPNTAGVFTLTANKTYRLQGSATYTGSDGSFNAQYQWRDITNNTLLGAGGLMWSMSNVTNSGNNQIAEAIVTPASNITVRLENLSGATREFQGSSGQLSFSSWATIVQLGTSAAITTTVFTGATSLVAGTMGAVPAPAIGDNSKILLGSGVFGSSLVGIRVLTTGTSYTPTSGTNKIIAYVIGGGGGGGAVAASASTLSGGGGGAGGVVGFSESVSDQTTYTYSIGAAGASSGAGGASSMTVNSNVYTSQGGLSGTDGTVAAPSVTSGISGGAVTPSVPTGNAFYASQGGAGDTAFSVQSNNHASGKGGANMFGTGGRGQSLNAAGSAIGVPGIGFGGGGGGGLQNNNTARAGGAGIQGAIQITELR